MRRPEMPLLYGPVPQKKYSLLTTALFSGWIFNAGVSDEKRNRLVFERDGYLLLLSEKDITLFLPGETKGLRRPYSFLRQDHKNPGFIYNVSSNLDSFDLRAPEKGLQPAIVVHRETYFKPMCGLLTRFQRNKRRPPLAIEFVNWVRQHRKQSSLPGDTNRIHRLLKLGNYNFWVLEQKVDDKGRHIEILPLRGR
jgi:hypothetical protein